MRTTKYFFNGTAAYITDTATKMLEEQCSVQARVVRNPDGVSGTLVIRADSDTAMNSADTLLANHAVFKKHFSRPSHAQAKST